MRRRGSRPGSAAPPAAVIVLFDADCGFCSWSATFLDRLDRARALRLVPLQSAANEVPSAPARRELLETLHVGDGAGRWLRGGDACLEIASVIPVLRPLAMAGRLPLVRRGVDRAYRLVARNRHRLTRLLRKEGCTYRPR